jgi:hypothetical protein
MHDESQTDWRDRSSTVLVGPVTARQPPAHPGKQTESTYCATIEPGNPYSPACDYEAWSAWRKGGGWDSRGDDACARNPMRLLNSAVKSSLKEAVAVAASFIFASADMVVWVGRHPRAYDTLNTFTRFYAPY